MPQQCRKQCVQLTISLNGATPYLICMSVVVEKLLKIADVCVPRVHVYVCVSKMYMCVSKMYICIHDVHLYPWEYLYVWFQDVYLNKSMCTTVCIPKIYLCVSKCVWVYQRCVCVLVCLFIRNFFLVHWADFLSDLSDQMLSGFFVHLFLASYVFLKIVCIFLKYIYFCRNNQCDEGK